MAKIKKISFGDILHIKKLISVVCSDNVMNYRRLFFVSVPVTYLLIFKISYITYISEDILRHTLHLITITI